MLHIAQIIWREFIMPCRHAMIQEGLVTSTKETTLEQALEIFDKHKIRSIPVVDADNNLLGLFNFHQLLVTILPIPSGVGHNLDPLDISLDHLFGQSEWLSERLHNHLHRSIGDLMIKDLKTVNPDTPIGEGVRLLAHYGSPVAVTDENSNKLIGIITSQSVIKVLLEMKGKS